MKTLGLFAVAACSLTSASAAYVYDFPNLLNPYTASQWTENGTITAANNLVTSSDAGSLVFNQTVPGVSNSYEVRTTLALTASGGNYAILLRATSNARRWPLAGTAYMVQVQLPTVSTNSCSAGIEVSKIISATLTVLYTGPIPCGNGMVMRAVMTQSNYILVYLNNVLYASVYDTSISSGQPGIALHDTPTGNGITTIDIGHLDTVAPNPVSSITGTAFRDRVDLQWPAASDDPNGIGIAYYSVLRNGTQVAQITSTNFSDFTATANNTYAYSVYAVDYHWNNAGNSTNVTTPATVIDPRETGIRPTGSYWGGGGEEIDMRSGNLNFTMPTVKGVGRGGWSVPFQLSYNSQNWRQDTAGTWQVGLDTGYGYGWRLSAGSLTPLYSSAWVIAGYLFIDSTGAEYLLTVNTSNVWTSKESIYIYFDATAGKLHFTDGSFWTFGSTSALTEQDAGTMYPTMMEDSNGNQVAITYDDGVSLTWGNTSSRISTIEDVRGNGSNDYTFTYTYLNLTDPFPHLTKITNSIHTGEKYTYSYTDASLISPFDHVTSFGTFAFLESAQQTNFNASSFTYDGGGSGELDQVTTPYGGHLRWTYAPYTLASTLTYREVQSRFLLSKSTGASETEIDLIRGSDSQDNVHQSALLKDALANAEKYWTFDTQDAPYLGLQLSYQECQLPGADCNNAMANVLSHLDFTWTVNSPGDPYIGTTVTKLNPGQSYEADKTTTQTLDQYGNLLGMSITNFANVNGTTRTYTNTYLSSSNYTSLYILNRLSTSKVTDGTNTATLVSNYYDGSTLTSVTGAYEHDANYTTSFIYRGNVTGSSTPTASSATDYDITGNVTSTSTNGVTTNVTTNSTTNYAAPSAITTNTLNSTIAYTSFLGPSSVTDPNLDTGLISYDVTARPSMVTSPYGAVTNYTYNDTQTPPNKVAITNGHSVTTVIDGFGRTTQTVTGYGSNGSTPLSITDAQYAPCGCSPLGKLSQQSQPYAPGGSDAWTVYHYDASGRTTSVVQPDGSTTSYYYMGNNVLVYDPAGNWKSFLMDAFGNLVDVWEPDPTLGTVGTGYGYDVLNHLTNVWMTRGSNSQTRTFNYNTGTTVTGFLQSATNPENGTVSYTYNSPSNTLAGKTDAKNQHLTYQYDSYNRLTSVTWANSPNGAQVLRNYYYDTNPLDSSGFSQNTLGRLAAVQYPNIAQNPDAGSTPLAIQMNEMYSYVASTSPGAGLPSAKRLQVNQVVYFKDNNNNTQHGTVTVNLDSTSTYNNEGKVTVMTYPSTINGSDTPVPGPTYNYSYDSMYRLSGMTSGSTTVVSGVSYNAANQLLGMSYSGVNETRGYNVLNQLTSLNNGTANLTYAYPTGTNNGKVSSMYNAVSGETVTYTYDSLNRIATANGSGWGEQYTFDGFGNLTEKHVTAGSGPSMSVGVNESTNQLVGTTYDANGNAYQANVAYDVENHVYALVGASPYPVYSYDAQSRRTFLWSGTYDSENNSTNYSVVVYSPSGQKLGTYLFTPGEYSKNGGAYQAFIGVSLPSSDMYFGSRRLAAMDQLGSVGTFYPWGEAKGGTNPQDTWSYATYWRDSANGLDYANNRYYSNAYGRFMTPDPYQASGGPSDPGSWNRYAYTRGDPVNRNDPLGLMDCADCIGGDGGDGGGDPGSGGDPGYGGDPTGYCPPSEQSCAPFPSGGGTGSQGGSGGGTGGSGSAITLGQLQGLQTAGIVSGLNIGTTGVDFSFVGPGGVIAAAACAADPFCDLAAVVAGGVVTIYIAYKYLPGFIQAIEDAEAESEECRREWDYAFNKCAALLTQKNPPRGMTGGHTNLYECAKGFVRQTCGGNLIDWGRQGHPR